MLIIVSVFGQRTYEKKVNNLVTKAVKGCIKQAGSRDIMVGLRLEFFDVAVAPSRDKQMYPFILVFYTYFLTYFSSILPINY